MFSRSRLVAVAASVAVVFGLSGCGLFVPQVDEEPLSDIAQCAMGHTWTLDTTDLSAKLLAELQRDFPTVGEVVTTGSKVIEWGSDFGLDVTSDLTITITFTAPTPDQVVTVRQTQIGTASGTAFINTDVAIPRDWENGIEVETTADLGGVPQDRVGITVPPTAFDDTVGLILTCDGASLSITPRGASITQMWTAG